MEQEEIYQAFNIPKSLREEINNNKHIDDQWVAFVQAMAVMRPSVIGVDFANGKDFTVYAKPPQSKILNLTRGGIERGEARGKNIFGLLA